MSHKIKALILAAFATLALSAVGVSLSQAKTTVDAVLKGGHTKGVGGGEELTNTTLTGTQYGTEENNFFQTDAGKTICTNSGVDFAATVEKEAGKKDPEGNSEYLTVTAAYDECETGEKQATTVNMNGCDYTFESPDTTIAEGKFTGGATLYCPEGQDIEISVFLFRNGHTSHSFKVCTIKVGPNANETHHPLGGHIVYENISTAEPETKDHITAWATINEVPYEGCGSERKTNGTYENKVTLKGFNDTGTHKHGNEQLDVWLED